MGPKKGKRNVKKSKTNGKKSRSKSKQKQKKEMRKSESKGRKSRGKGSENQNILENEKRFEDEEEDVQQTDDEFEVEEDEEERPQKQRVKKQGRGRVGSNQETEDESEDEDDNDSDSANVVDRDIGGKSLQNTETDRNPKIPSRSESTLSTRYALNHPKAVHTTDDRNAGIDRRLTASPSTPVSSYQKNSDQWREFRDRIHLDSEHPYVRPQNQSPFQQQKSSVYGSRNIPVFQQKSGPNYGSDYDYRRRPRTPEPQYPGSSNSFVINTNLLESKGFKIISEIDQNLFKGFCTDRAIKVEKYVFDHEKFCHIKYDTTEFTSIVKLGNYLYIKMFLTELEVAIKAIQLDQNQKQSITSIEHLITGVCNINIVHIFDVIFDNENSVLYIVSEFVNNSLIEFIRTREEGILVYEFINFSKQLFNAVKYLRSIQMYFQSLSSIKVMLRNKYNVVTLKIIGFALESDVKESVKEIINYSSNISEIGKIIIFLYHSSILTNEYYGGIYINLVNDMIAKKFNNIEKVIDIFDEITDNFEVNRKRLKIRERVRKSRSTISENKDKNCFGKRFENQNIFENEKTFEDEEEDVQQTDDEFEVEEDEEERPQKQRVKKQGRGRVGTKQETEDESEDEDDNDSDSANVVDRDIGGKGLQNIETDRNPKIPSRSESTLSTRYALNHPKALHTTDDRNAGLDRRRTPSPSRPVSSYQKNSDQWREFRDRITLDSEHRYVRPQNQSPFQQQKSSVYGSRNLPVFQQKSNQNYGSDYDYRRRPLTPEPQYPGSSNLGQPKQLPINRNQYFKGNDWDQYWG